MPDVVALALSNNKISFINFFSRGVLSFKSCSFLVSQVQCPPIFLYDDFIELFNLLLDGNINKFPCSIK